MFICLKKETELILSLLNGINTDSELDFFFV